MDKQFRARSAPLARSSTVATVRLNECDRDALDAYLGQDVARSAPDWINIQTDYDLEIERDRHGAELDKVTELVAS